MQLGALETIKRVRGGGVSSYDPFQLTPTDIDENRRLSGGALQQVFFDGEDIKATDLPVRLECHPLIERVEVPGILG